MIVDSEFSPPWWLRNPHLQTLTGSKIFKPPKITTLSQRIERNDGDFTDINVCEDCVGDPVAIFHGLAGCFSSSYVQGAFNSLLASGFSPVLMHWRGCSGEPNRLSRSYHSGSSDEVAWFIEYLRQRFDQRPVHAVGFSLGANALLKYLGESGEQSGLTSALAVSPPLVLQVGANQLSQGFSRIYQYYLLALLRKQHERKRSLYPELNLPPATEKLKNFWAFDDALTAPLHGFANVHDYYEKCSSRQYLPAIKTPTWILCALDDPFFNESILPEENELSSSTTLELSRRGGHVGFIGDQARQRRWLDHSLASRLRG
ncbi:MAG: hydrolase [Granulosicoccus sp.]|nr:hydrolase [Granulosicoccus sp.]